MNTEPASLDEEIDEMYRKIHEKKLIAFNNDLKKKSLEGICALDYLKSIRQNYDLSTYDGINASIGEYFKCLDNFMRQIIDNESKIRRLLSELNYPLNNFVDLYQSDCPSSMFDNLSADVFNEQTIKHIKDCILLLIDSIKQAISCILCILNELRNEMTRLRVEENDFNWKFEFEELCRRHNIPINYFRIKFCKIKQL